MTEKYGFVYIWRDKKHNRYYVGCHWGAVDDGYICSSDWMRKAFRRRPGDFRRRIIISNLTRKEMYLEEQRMFSMIKPEELKTRYYNLRLTTPLEPWHADPDKRLSVGQKISKANKGRKAPCTPERAAAISKGKKGKPLVFTEEGRARKLEAAKNRVVSDETKQATSASLRKYYEQNESKRKGRTLTKEHKDAISEKLTGIKRDYVMTDARKEAMQKRSEASAKALKGSRAYNNGSVEKRFKEHPGEGWVLGGLPRNRSVTK